MVDRDRNKLLWSEMTREEKEEEKKDFVHDYMHETGCSEEIAKMQWWEYLNQEGYTCRDEHISMMRDAKIWEKPS